MSAHHCADAQRSVERAFVDGDAGALAQLHAEISSCERCRGAIETLLDAETALAAPSPFGPMRRALLLEHALPAASAAAPRHGRRRRRARWAVALSGAAAACVAAVLGVIFFGSGSQERRTPHDDPGRFRRRSATRLGGGDAGALPRVGLRVLCLRVGADGTLSAHAAGTNAARCRRADRIGFSVFNHGERRRHLSIFVVGPRGRVLEAYASSAQRALLPRSGERPLDVGVSLDALGAGTIQIIALITDEPTTPARRRRVVAALRDGRTPTVGGGDTVFRTSVTSSE